MNTVKWFTTDSSSHNIHFLLKYHPKYYHNLHFTTSDLRKPKVFTKIRALKVINSLDVPNYEAKARSLVLSALKSQRDCLKDLNMKDPALVKHYPRIETFLVCSNVLISWRVFLRLRNLKTLKLECPYLTNPESSRIAKELGKIRSFSWRFWQHYEKLKALENFHVYLYNKIDTDLLRFLAKLNSLKDELGSLRSFSLFLSHIDVRSNFDLDFESLYKYLTSLQIHESSLKTIGKLLKNVRRFQKLESLNILKNLTYPEDDQDTVDFSYSKYFLQLNRMKSLDIFINFGSSSNFLNFLEHFSIPECLISLKLSFYESDWSALLSSSQLNNLKNVNAFEAHPLCVNFYNKWQSLHSLKSLSLCFCESDPKETPSLYFTAPILKNLTTLETLYFANWVNDFSNAPQAPSAEKIKALNFYYLWKSLQHLKPTLRKLFVDSSAISLRKFPSHFELEDQEKLVLEELGICGLIVGDIYLEVLSKNLRKDERDRPSKMAVESILIDNQGSMVKVMESMANISKKVRVSVSLDMRKVKGADFMQILTNEFVRVTSKSHIKIDFSKIPELSDFDLKIFKTIIYEYQKARLHAKDKADSVERGRNSQRTYSSEEFFGSLEGMIRGEGPDVFSLGDEEEEFEESEEDDEDGYEDDDADEEISDMMEEMGYFLDDGLEDIDEDI